ncbi:hypothetical protein Q3G72_008712 [Acer saccharum]|nr:hypothetical protein Q3G72_008712 [Acer saccharum]
MLLRHISLASSSHRTAKLGAHTDAQQLHTRRHACSSARNAAQNACVCLPELMETSISALATITGRPRKEDPNVLEK